MWTPTQELDQKLAVASHAVSYIGVKHSLFAGALEQEDTIWSHSLLRNLLWNFPLPPYL